jgi:putative hydrolase of the HAD superfamily
MDLQGIKAITFDAGGTLLDPWPSVGEIYANVAAEVGFPGLSADKLNSQFATAWKRKKNFDYSEAAWCHLVNACFSGLLPCPISPKLFEALYEQFAQPHVWRVYDDVRLTLETLRQRGVRLGVISNWDLRLGPLLERLELSRYLDCLVLSVNVGATKPSPRIFQYTSEALNLAPRAILHVGDSVEEDVRGAESAGMRALLLDRKEENPCANIIPSLSALL